MNKFIAITLGVISGVLWAQWGHVYLSPYLLSQELQSDNTVAQIQNIANNKISPDDEKIVFNNQSLEYPADELDLLAQLDNSAVLNSPVLGLDSNRWIEVNLTQQKLYMWEGGNKVGEFLVSTGRWAPTPTGNFSVWIKLAKTRMQGGSIALHTYYNLPNVPCTMYFYKGYGIHGAYWHNNFGHPMSHGCVNMRTNEACTVFNWASVGTRVNIHY